jgi:hypothetical protein
MILEKGDSNSLSDDTLTRTVDGTADPGTNHPSSFEFESRLVRHVDHRPRGNGKIGSICRELHRKTSVVKQEHDAT